MDKLEEKYQKLTGIDISEQRKIWDERGKGYYGEFLLFRDVYIEIQGCCKILMNLQVPTSNGKTTEIDLVLVHESGIYVFEAKHYKGTIYGTNKDVSWTQYFRTTKNSHFNNPVMQNEYHIKALKDKFPDIPIYSIIVFTNSECDLKVKCDNSNITICKLNELRSVFKSLSNANDFMDIDRIDAVFNELSAFSPMTEKTVTVNEKVIPFYDYIHEITKDYNNQKEMLDTEYSDKHKILQKRKMKIIIGAFIACFICIIFCIAVSLEFKATADEQVTIAQKELNDFKQKFERVKDFNEGELSFSDNLAEVLDVLIEPSGDINNTVLVSFSLKHTGNNYGICIHSESTIILILKDGTVVECPIFNEKYPFRSDFYLGSVISGNTCTILPHEFYNIFIEDINYVKLSNVDVWTQINDNNKIVFSGYEVEVFMAE